MEQAKAYFTQAVKLNPQNIRALYGLLLVSCELIIIDRVLEILIGVFIVVLFS